MNALAPTAPPPALRSPIVAGWRWRTHGKGAVCPSTMQTTHLFYTLRMIWNHHMPLNMRVGGRTRQWRFGPRHDQRYMREAIVHIAAELFSRTDLPPGLRDQLDEMAGWFTDVDARRFIEDARTVSLMRRIC